MALVVAEAFEGTVINADSMQVYRDLSLLTAKPSATDMAQVPHRLYSIFDATEKCSAARWLSLARTAVAEAHQAGRLPIVVGGTGLYLEVLQHGLAPVPEIPVAVQAETRALMAAIGPAAFHTRLAMRDPAMAARLHPLDTQRLQRAWEVIAATGYSLSDWWQMKTGNLYARFCSLLLMPARPVLHASCDGRFWHMVAAGGVVTEVADLLARNLPPGCPILKAMGVAALANYIRGRLTLEEAIVAGQTITRRYAKRQCTWFRHRLKDALTVPDRYFADHPSTIEILSFIHHFLLASKR
ncbi:tRNA dimethylallyltransferase [invertebrate metagenome]|uniref:tRNA dimethylallyltransferase n=1 Tax=invertebrate metagenome TaxID=1711999 RepID=A0A484H6I9_9ZZZZ